jgi:hypothetical protein
MTNRLTIMVLLLCVALTAACSPDDAGEAVIASAPAEEKPTSATPAETATSAVSSQDAFEGVPDPSGLSFDYEAEGPDGLCRYYSSSSPPYTLAQNYAELLADPQFGWEVEPVFSTGYTYEDSASFSATDGTRHMSVTSNGTGGQRAALNVCIRVP